MPDNTTVAAYFSSQAAAESAIDALEAAGFHKTQIGVAAADGDASQQKIEPEENTGYSAGHQAGTAWNKVKSFFGAGDSAEPYAGEASGATFNDNVITPGAYDSDDVHGSLGGLSVRDEHSRYFGHRLGGGTEGAVVTVNAAGRESEAADILEQAGGDLGGDVASYDYGDAKAPTSAKNIQLYGEVLRVHKDRVSRGEVRIRKEVHTTTQQIEVPVTREELVVERIPVSGNVPATGAAFNNEEIRIPLSEERAHVSKEQVVREEVRVGKKQTSTVETFDEKVRHEELNVDGNTGNATDKIA